MRLALTMGDPAGIGPEILVKLVADAGGSVAYGDPETLAAAADRWAPDLTVSVDGPEDQPNWMRVEPATPFSGSLGQVSASAGASSFDALRWRSIMPWQEKFKAWLQRRSTRRLGHDAGIEYPGHTEYLAERAECPVAMVLANDDLAVILATVHFDDRGGRTNPHRCRRSGLASCMAGRIGTRFESPRIAVAGLNPHAGEGGYLAKKKSNTSFQPFNPLAALKFQAPTRAIPFSCVHGQGSSIWWLQ